MQPVAVNVNVKDTLPAATPLTTPAFVTVATAGLLLVHVPPAAGVRLPVLPTQTAAGAVTKGLALIVTEEVVFVQPVAVNVNVKVTLPAIKPVITPAFVTVATAGLLLVHVPPAAGVRLPVLPTQTAAGDVTTGLALTVTEAVVLEQPVAARVNVNVTLPAVMPVITPALVTVAIAGLLLVHVPPAAGVRFPVLPTHTEAGAVTLGRALTVTDEVVFEQPVAV